MGGLNFEDELECLKASYDPSEFSYDSLNHLRLLKFFLLNNSSVTFEIPSTYPQSPPNISVTSNNLTKAERIEVEEEARSLAHKSIGQPMIMDLVIKLQQLINDYCKRDTTLSSRGEGAKKDDLYTAVILIDHMRQKKKYSSTLLSWASEMDLSGCLLFYQKWIFLILKGYKKKVKEFIILLKTVCIDVDSSGKRCKEKMSTVLHEGNSAGNFLGFSSKEITSLEDMEMYFIQSNMVECFIDIIKPIINKNR